MKKLICTLLIIVLAVSISACGTTKPMFMPNTQSIFVGTWSGDGNTLLLNDDGTGVLSTADGKTYDITWIIHVAPDEAYDDENVIQDPYKSYGNNPDSIDFVTVVEKGGNGVNLTTNPDQPHFPILKGNLNVTDGVLILSVFDGNAKDDDFTINMVLNRQP